MAGNTQGAETQTGSVSDFVRDAPAFVEKLKASGEPVLLHDQSGAEVVIQDAESYRRLLERLEFLEGVEAIREGLEDVRAGRTRPFREFFAELRKTHAIPD